VRLANQTYKGDHWPRAPESFLKEGPPGERCVCVAGAMLRAHGGGTACIMGAWAMTKQAFERRLRAQSKMWDTLLKSLALRRGRGTQKVARIPMPERTDQIWHAYLPELRAGRFLWVPVSTGPMPRRKAAPAVAQD